MTDAKFENAVGEQALSRMLVLGEGSYRLRLAPTAGNGTMELGAREFSTGLLPKVRRWELLRETSVPLAARLTVDFRRLADVLAELPEDVQRLARLFDGRRTVRAVVMDAACAETTALEAATRLYALGVLGPAEVDETDVALSAETSRPVAREAEPPVVPDGRSAESAEASPPSLEAQTSSSPLRSTWNDGADAPDISGSLSQHGPDVHALVEHGPVEHAAVEHGPVEHAAVEHAAVEHAAVGHAPVEHAPVEHAPVEQGAPIRLTEIVSSPWSAPSPDAAFFSDESVEAAAFRPRIKLPFHPRYLLAGLLLLGGAAVVASRLGGHEKPPPPPPVIPVPPPLPPIPMPELPEPKTVPSEEALKLLTQGMKLYDSGKMTEAVQTLEKAVEAVPDSDTAWVMLGLARFDSHDTHGAEEAAVRALELSPKNGRALILLASVYIALGNRPKAQEQLKSYLSAEPDGQFAEEAKRLLSAE